MKKMYANANLLLRKFYKYLINGMCYLQWWQKESGPSAILSKKEQTRVKRLNKSRKTVIFVPEIQYLYMIL